MIADPFARGETAAPAAHRVAECCHASPCGRLCRRLIKGPGLQAWCGDVRTGRRIDLYAALADPGFACAEELF